MAGAELDGARPDPEDVDVAALLPMVRRIVFSRVPNEAVAEDLVQETLVKVLAAANRVEPGLIEPFCHSWNSAVAVGRDEAQRVRRDTAGCGAVENGNGDDALCGDHFAGRSQGYRARARDIRVRGGARGDARGLEEAGDVGARLGPKGL